MTAAPCTRLLAWLVRLTLWISRTFPRERDNARVFDRAWQRLYPNRLVRALLACSRNKYALDERAHLYLLLLDQMHARGLAHRPRLSIAQPQAITEACAHYPSFVVVSAHNGLAFSTRSLLELGREVAVIVKNPASRKLGRTFGKSGVRQPVHLIANDKYCLFAMRDAVLAGKVVSCDIDFKSARHGSYDAVSPALFAFANKMELPVFFARNEIAEDGRATVLFDGPHRNMAPEQCAARFIRFLAPSHLPGRELVLRSYDKNRPPAAGDEAA